MKLFFTAITLVLFAPNAVAQESALNEVEKEKLKRHLIETYEELCLSEEQKPKFKESIEKYVLQIKSIQTNGHSKTENSKDLKSIIDSINKELKSMFSEEQNKVFEEIQEVRLSEFNSMKESLAELGLSEEHYFLLFIKLKVL